MILQSDIDRATDMLSKLWPKWTPNAEELRLWGSRIRKTRADMSVIMAAIDEARAGSHYAAPSIRDFGEAVTMLGGQSAQARRTQPRPAVATGVWVMCLEDAERPAHIGAAPQIVFASVAATPSPDRVSRIAHAHAERCSDLYGGQWAVLVDHSPADVHQMAWAMRHDEPMPTFGRERTRQLAQERGTDATQLRQPAEDVRGSHVQPTPRQPDSTSQAGRAVPPPPGVRPATVR